MSNFSHAWSQCMNRKGMPVPDLDTLNEALEFLDQLHSALENAGGELDTAITIGSLVSAGALAQVSEDALVVLGAVATVAATVYISNAIGCAFAVATPDIRRLFATNDLPAFVVDELGSQGADLNEEAAA